MALWFLLANDPETAWFLQPEEKQLLIARLRRQTGYHEEFDKKDAILAAKDVKVWLFAIGQFGVNSMLYSYSIFLPSIIRGAFLLVSQSSHTNIMLTHFQVLANGRLPKHRLSLCPATS